jgi:Ca2+-binding RTX toxin-like protein
VHASVSWTLGANFENLVLTGTKAIDGAGNALNNVITGNAASNPLDGKLGADRMIGGGGNDIYYVDNAKDVVIEVANGGTADEIRASVTYVLAANVENLRLTGTGQINGTGKDLANILTGNDGGNFLDGRAGADQMAGGLGDDTYLFDGAGDVAIESRRSDDCQ